MSLEQRVRHLESQYESLDGTVHKILIFTKNTHDILMGHVTESRKRFERLEGDVSELKSDVSELKSDVSELKSDMSEVKSMLKQFLLK